MMNDILNNFIGGQNSENSFFSSGHNFPSRSNFLPELNCNNRIHSNLNKSYFPFIDEHNVSDNRPKNTINGQNSNTVSSVPAGSSHGKHSLFKKYDHISCKLFILFLYIYL
jgi:hypothetical protein